METPILQGKHIRLEPLELRHVGGLVAAAGDDAALYQWSPVPRGKAAAKTYIDTALAWRDAGTAVPFAIVREQDGIVLGSTRFWNIERWSWPQGHPSHGRECPRRVRDRLHVAHPFGHADGGQHRGQTVHAHACLRSMAGAARLLSHRRPQPTLSRRARTHRWSI